MRSKKLRWTVYIHFNIANLQKSVDINVVKMEKNMAAIAKNTKFWSPLLKKAARNVLW